MLQISKLTVMKPQTTLSADEIVENRLNNALELRKQYFSTHNILEAFLSGFKTPQHRICPSQSFYKTFLANDSAKYAVLVWPSCKLFIFFFTLFAAPNWYMW